MFDNYMWRYDIYFIVFVYGVLIFYMWLICFFMFYVLLICFISKSVILLREFQVFWVIVLCRWNGFNDYLLNECIIGKKKIKDSMVVGFEQIFNMFFKLKSFLFLQIFCLQ